jgi:hypothetical protein
MDIKPIRTKKDYETTLKAIERLMGAKRGSPRLDVLVTLVEALRGPAFPPGSARPGRCPLTMAMAWKLDQGLGILLNR